MNIKDAISEEVTKDPLQAIFDRQKELMVKYHDIEGKSGLLQTLDCPVNLDDKKGQARLKDFAWRITEELGEALDSLYVDKDKDHFKEELVDGLHFLTEFSILAGFTPEVIAKYTPRDNVLEFLFGAPALSHSQSLEGFVTAFIQNLGMTCNCLKNKPWKQSQMLTDKGMFYERLFQTWKAYFCILFYAFNNHREVLDTYLKKSQVNKFRQRSNY